VVCGYLDPDLKRVADELLLESREPVEIEARDLREERSEAPTDEFQAPEAPRPRRITAGYRASRPVAEPAEPAAAEPDEPQAGLQGVTPSVDWVDEDPESYSAPV
jgi:hypothetical protein